MNAQDRQRLADDLLQRAIHGVGADAWLDETLRLRARKLTRDLVDLLAPAAPAIAPPPMIAARPPVRWTPPPIRQRTPSRRAPAPPRPGIPAGARTTAPRPPSPSPSPSLNPSGPRAPAADSATAGHPRPPPAAPPPPPSPPPLRASIAANGRAGEPFRAAVQVVAEDQTPIRILDARIAPEIGVAFDAATSELFGEAPASGEHPVRLVCAPAATDPPETGQSWTAEVETTLVINPDPRSLWQERPSDRKAVGWKTDRDALLQLAPHERRVLLGSVRGRSHAHIGGFRDDDFACQVAADADGWTLLAVADGAGSASRARIGSRIAAETAVAAASHRLAGDSGARLEASAQDAGGGHPPPAGALGHALYTTLGAAAFESAKALETLANDEGFGHRDYATTLLLAAHKQGPRGAIVATYWVGDGAIGLYHDQRGIDLLGVPDGGEFAGQTRFLDAAVVSDGAEIMKRLCVRLVPDFTALLLMTDGVSDPYFPADDALRARADWDRLWGDLQETLTSPDPAAAVLPWLEFWSRGHHDDRTLAVLW